MTTRISLLLVLVLSTAVCWAQGERGDKSHGRKDHSDRKATLGSLEKQQREAIPSKIWPRTRSGVSSRGMTEGMDPVVERHHRREMHVSSYSLEETKVTWLDSNTACSLTRGTRTPRVRVKRFRLRFMPVPST